MRANVVPVLLLAACGGADPAPPEEQPEDDGGERCDRVWEIRTGPDAIDAGEEGYRNDLFVVPESGFAVRFDPISSDGVVHHAILTRGAADGPTAPTIFAAGRGTGPLVFPDGVGIRLDEGETIGLGLHVANATDAPAPYDWGVLVCLVDEVLHESDVFVVGPETIEIPPDGAPHDLSASCPVEGDRTVFAAFPHMHARGRAIRIEARGEAIAAEDWNFAEQPRIALDPPAVLEDGDPLGVTCTFVNDGPDPVSWGPYSEDEMCLAFVHYYPAGMTREWGCR